MNKRSIRAAIIGLVFAGSIHAFATISVNWFTFGTIYLSDGTTPLPVGSIAQLIWTPDPAISPFSSTDALIPDSSERLLLQIATTDPGAIYYGTTNFVEEEYGLSDTNYFANGYVYTRVFNYLLANGSPSYDTDWGDGPRPPDGPVASQHAPSTPPEPTLADITGGDSYIIVPEPTTATILGISLVTLAARRFRKKPGHTGRGR